MRYVLAALIAAFVGLSFVAVSKGAEESTHVTLKKRVDHAYGDASYSFRKATSDPAVHRNYFDLLLNNCGSLHINMVTGQKNRITDLGEMKLADAPDEAPADAKWLSESVKPLAGHCYLEEINQRDEVMTVKFVVDDVTDDVVKLTWITVKPQEGEDDPNRGAGGRMGLCGGPHDANE